MKKKSGKHMQWLRKACLDNAEVTKVYFRDGGGSVGESLVSLNITIGNVQLSEQPMLNGNWIEKVTTKNGNA